VCESQFVEAANDVGHESAKWPDPASIAAGGATMLNPRTSAYHSTAASTSGTVWPTWLMARDVTGSSVDTLRSGSGFVFAIDRQSHAHDR